MEPIKTTKNLEFDVIYADGTREHVKEGILFGVEDNGQMTLHNGTNRLSVLFASIETAFAAVEALGAVDMLLEYLEQGADNGEESKD